MSVLEGLSHIMLTAPSIEKFESCVQFYCRFGYKSISHLKASNEAAQFLSREEQVLHLFGNPPAQDITIKIVLTENTTEKKEPFPGERDWRLEQTSAIAVTKDIVVCNIRLSDNFALFQKLNNKVFSYFKKNEGYRINLKFY